MKFVPSKPNHAIIDLAQPVALPGWIVLLGIVLTPMGLKALVINTTTLAGSAGTTVTTGVTGATGTSGAASGKGGPGGNGVGGGAGGLGGDGTLGGLQKTFIGRLGHGCLAQGISFLGYLITGSEVRLSSETLRRHHVKARQLYEQCKTRQRQAARVFADGNTIAGFAPPWLQARAHITLTPQMRDPSYASV
jgi:hypothetical protein